MKKLAFFLTLALGLSVFAQQRQELVSLTCTGANGLKLSVNSRSKIVNTELGGFKKQFETNRTVFTHKGTFASISRITLGQLGAANAYVYDIYLKSIPKRGVKSEMTGVIGHTVHAVGFVPGSGPFPWPVAFVPTTTVNCNVLTK